MKDKNKVTKKLEETISKVKDPEIKKAIADKINKVQKPITK